MNVAGVDAALGRRGTRFIGISTVEVADKAWEIEIAGGFPGIVIRSVTFPTDKIEQLRENKPTIQNFDTPSILSPSTHING